MTPRMYGIKNCDTVAKARAWLSERAIAYDFHDYKTQGIDAARLIPKVPRPDSRGISSRHFL